MTKVLMNEHGGATRVLAIRHGETAWNVDTRIQGQIDVGLNEVGQWQARRLADWVASEERLAAVYSSDLQRAWHTAAALGAGAGLPVVAEPGLRERHFGAFEGHTVAEIETHFPDLVQPWRQREPDFSPEGGESLNRFYARCVQTAERLAAAHPGETIALVAHGGVLDCLYRAAMGMAIEAPRTWQLGNASINRLLFTGQRFTVIGWGDTFHLEGDVGLLDESGDGGLAARPS
ncbi:MAG: histidine phosphatase family protein [Burkholderiales bacterium]